MGIGKVCCLLLVVLLGACEEEIAYSTGRIRSVISRVFEDQAIANLGPFIDDPLTIPNQILLAQGTTQVQNGVTTGIAPNIAFRAIALTGIELSSNNVLQQSWATIPVVDFDKIARLQLLYNYALGSGQPADDGAAPPTRFADFERQFTAIEPTVPALSASIGALPDGPFILNGDNGGCNDNATRALSGGHVICFADNRQRGSVNGENVTTGPLKSISLRSLFVLWTLATTEVARKGPPGDTPGATQAGKPPQTITGAPKSVPTPEKRLFYPTSPPLQILR
ncbi:MAG: hypothetical protein WDN25_18385 [Acetobacteraceae bacterium]